jgi:phenylalanyl-tRNA synthetase beta chain
MKISYQWINQRCELDLSLEQMIERLTLLGLEVGQAKPRAQAFSQVIVAQILDAQQHPNADRLRVCKVFDGENHYEVVCGAPNARAGIKVAFAKIGAVLPGNFKIKKSKIRGETSFGMLCSARELGLGEEHDGIIELAEDAPVGENFRTYKNLDDIILDLELTPNRGDCFSLRGVARELCADQNIPFKDFNFKEYPAEHKETFKVILSAEQCPIFAGCLIKNVDCSVPSPQWLVDALEGSGIRSISLIVDITNYVMLSLGQPMHAYDADYLNDNIEVRYAQKDDALTLLDGSKPDLESDMLLITSKQPEQKSKVLGLAGIMGGEECGISDKTTSIYFEAAHFTPQYSIGKARSLGMQTEASMRFERGVDPSMTKVAINYAADLVKTIAGGEIGEVVVSQHPSYEEYIQRKTPVTNLSITQIKSSLGIDINISYVQEVLDKLGIKSEQIDEHHITVRSPIHRFDLEIAEDYAEEIARHYGYENILKGTQSFAKELTLPQNSDHSYSKKRRCKQHLSSLGISEAISYCFIDNNKQNILFPEHSVCRLLNPISSDLDVMRLSLLPGLLANTLHNHHHQQTHVALFELGLCFMPEQDNPSCLEQIQQTEKLAFVVSNQWHPRHWRGEKKVDFYIVKGIFESLLKCFSIKSIEYSIENLPSYAHPGQSANILFDNQVIGTIGMFHPNTLDSYDIKTQVGFCEIDWAVIQTFNPAIKYQKFAMYPRVYRDLAIIVNKDISAKVLTLTINSWKIKYLTDIQIFDIYEGKGVESGTKSVGICLQFESFEGTLSDEQITKSFNEVQEKFSSQFQATVRSK